MDLAARLAQLGYFNPPGGRVGLAPSVPSPDDVADALSRYAEFHGLPNPASPDPQTIARHMSLPRCGLPDFAARADATLCKWPHKAIRFYCGIALAGFSADQVRKTYTDAVDSWGAVADIYPEVGFGSTVKARANIVSTAAPGDGPSNVLAWSYLPCGATADTQLQQSYDSLEPWTTYGIKYLQEVIAHEIGHALGLDHLPAGALMQPYASGKLIVPQAADIREVQARYGKPAGQPVPPVNPPTPGPSGTRLAGWKDADTGAILELWRKPST